MWMLIARAAPPDSPYWPGRRWFAALDAIGWPMFWLGVLSHIPVRTGLVGTGLASVAVIVGLYRLRIALWRTHRYRFTTWRWGRLLLALLVFGAAIKHIPM